jgi:hypothetical protein
MSTKLQMDGGVVSSYLAAMNRQAMPASCSWCRPTVWRDRKRSSVLTCGGAQLPSGRCCPPSACWAHCRGRPGAGQGRARARCYHGVCVWGGGQRQGRAAGQGRGQGRAAHREEEGVVGQVVLERHLHHPVNKNAAHLHRQLALPELNVGGVRAVPRLGGAQGHVGGAAGGRTSGTIRGIQRNQDVRHSLRGLRCAPPARASSSRTRCRLRGAAAASVTCRDPAA